MITVAGGIVLGAIALFVLSFIVMLLISAFMNWIESDKPKPKSYPSGTKVVSRPEPGWWQS